MTTTQTMPKLIMLPKALKKEPALRRLAKKSGFGARETENLVANWNAWKSMIEKLDPSAMGRNRAGDAAMVRKKREMVASHEMMSEQSQAAVSTELAKSLVNMYERNLEDNIKSPDAGFVQRFFGMDRAEDIMGMLVNVVGYGTLGPLLQKNGKSVIEKLSNRAAPLKTLALGMIVGLSILGVAMKEAYANNPLLAVPMSLLVFPLMHVMNVIMYYQKRAVRAHPIDEKKTAV